MNQELPKRLYHYCSLQSLRGIIEKKHLRMTSVFWMDDTTEVFWLYEVVTRVLDRHPPDERNALLERFRRLMKDRRTSYVFCTCFSAEPDARSQWLEYADDGHGFAIGFDRTTFDLQRPGRKRAVELEPVKYDEQEQERIAEEVIDVLQESDNAIENEARVSGAKHDMWWHAARCKNPAFENEKESRLIYRGDPGDDLEFGERGGRHLIPYITFPFKPAENPIREIRLGPRNLSRRNVDATKLLLSACGYDADQIIFRPSEIPLRREY